MNSSTSYQVLYVSRILAGLVLLTLLLFGAEAYSEQSVGLSLAFVAPFLLIYPVFRWLHGRADEMEQELNNRACRFAVPTTAIAAILAGELQQLGKIPELNLMWVFAFIVGAWGIGLMLANRKFL